MSEIQEPVKQISSTLIVGDHHKDNYAKFKDWFLDHYALLGAVVIPLQSRFEASPLNINLQQILWDAYMARESEVQDLKRKIQMLEKTQKNS